MTASCLLKVLLTALKETGEFPSEISATGTRLAPSRHQVAILRRCRKEAAMVDLMAVAKRSDRSKFRNQILKPLLESKLVEMTLPDKPSSRWQRYVITAAGRDLLDECKAR